MKENKKLIIIGVFFLILVGISFTQAQIVTPHTTNIYICTNNGWEFYDSVQRGSMYHCLDPEDSNYRYPESKVDKCLSYRPE